MFYIPSAFSLHAVKLFIYMCSAISPAFQMENKPKLSSVRVDFVGFSFLTERISILWASLVFLFNNIHGSCACDSWFICTITIMRSSIHCVLSHICMFNYIPFNEQPYFLYKETFRKSEEFCLHFIKIQTNRQLLKWNIITRLKNWEKISRWSIETFNLERTRIIQCTKKFSK